MATVKAKIKFKDIDKGWKKTIGQIGSLKGTYVQVGIQAGDKADARIKNPGGTDTIVRTSIDLALVAAWNEFGTDHSPSRPFMRQTFDENEAELTKRIKAEYQAVVNGKKTAAHSLELLGMWYQQKIQDQITEGDFEPNAKRTTDRKGSTRPFNRHRPNASKHTVHSETGW